MGEWRTRDGRRARRRRNEMSEGSGNEGRGGTHTALRRTDRTRLEPHFDLYTEPACSGYNQTGNYVTFGDRRGDRTLRTT